MAVCLNSGIFVFFEVKNTKIAFWGPEGLPGPRRGCPIYRGSTEKKHLRVGRRFFREMGFWVFGRAISTKTVFSGIEFMGPGTKNIDFMENRVFGGPEGEKWGFWSGKPNGSGRAKEC